MALDAAQERVIDQILERARDGRLRKPYVNGDVAAQFIGEDRTRFRVRITGATARDVVNDWVTVLATKAGHAERKPAPRQDQVHIEVHLNT